MINLYLSINNPFSERFSIVSTSGGMITAHKAWEANIYCTANIAKLTLAYSIRRDHAGLQIEFGLFGYECEFRICDTRHWDYSNKCWEVYSDADGLL